MKDCKVYDVVIIGGGPAGYTAALYAARAGLVTLVLEKFCAGGQMFQTQQIDNYPGFDEGIEGFELGHKMQKGAERFGAVTIQAEVVSVRLSTSPKSIESDAGTFQARTVIIAAGADHRHLGLANEEHLIGRGVSYCASCDGMLYRGKVTAVVGGGNSAAANALLLSRICRKVYMIHRRDAMRADKIYQESLMHADNIEFRWNSEVTELLFDRQIRGIRVKNHEGLCENIDIDGLFISIGQKPETSLFREQLTLDETGYIVADETTRTNVAGVYAAGDIRSKRIRQIVTAVADGAVAACFAEQYLVKT